MSFLFIIQCIIQCVLYGTKCFVWYTIIEVTLLYTAELYKNLCLYAQLKVSVKKLVALPEYKLLNIFAFRYSFHVNRYTGKHVYRYSGVIVADGTYCELLP